MTFMQRRVRITLGLILLIISCVLLLWGVWPALRLTQVLPLPPSDLTLPTPASFSTSLL
jgi:hypothetical protein